MPGVQRPPWLCCVTPGWEQGSQQSSLHVATSLPRLQRQLPGQPGWRNGAGEGPPAGAALPQLLLGWGRGFLLR